MQRDSRFASILFGMYRIVCLLCVFIIGNIELLSQEYTPLLKENATWIMWYSPDDFIDFYYHAFRLEGDTTVDGYSSKKVFFYDLEPNQSDPYIVKSRLFVGVLREDEVAQRVYGTLYSNVWSGTLSPKCQELYYQQPEQEMLLLDFNKIVGDTLLDCQIDDDEYGTVITKDTIEHRFGKNRRIISNSRGLELIQGIGYDDGLFNEAHTWVSAGWGFGMQEYCIASNDMCSLVTATQEVRSEIGINIYPNPTFDDITIAPTENMTQSMYLIMYDLFGRVVLREDIEQTTTMQLGNHMSSGTYFYMIKDGRGFMVQSGKIIVL